MAKDVLKIFGREWDYEKFGLMLRLKNDWDTDRNYFMIFVFAGMWVGLGAGIIIGAILAKVFL